MRNRRFDRGDGVQRAAAPVISVGNITTGGTGKTPLVMHVVRRLQALGARPAILTRGYRSTADSQADEVLEYKDELPETAVVVNPDRVAGAEEALRGGADCLVLDDGFQHRRLARNLDIVLIDALNPWGGGRLLPAGDLREPLAGLRRAGVIVVNRADQVDAGEIEVITQRIGEIAPKTPCLLAAVRPLGATGFDGKRELPEELSYRCVQPVCGIGNPASFVRSVQTLAGSTATAIVFRDHHRYSPRDVEQIQSQARAADADLVLTTRKDWVKLAPLWPRGDQAIELARLDTELVPHDPARVLSAALAAALEAHP